jgi:predicted DNA-binding transcriptional regulator AlpA
MSTPRKSKSKPEASHALADDEIVRLCNAEKYFGVKRSRLREKIESGEVPRPFKISNRAVGWLGSQIHQYQRALREKAS